MSAHGIPSVLSVCAEEVGSAYASGPESPGYAPPGVVPGTVLPAVSRGEGPAGETRDHAVAVDVQGGLHRMRYPFHWRLNRLVGNPPGPVARSRCRCPRNLLQPGDSHNPPEPTACSRSGAATPISPIPVRSAVCAAAASHSLAVAWAASVGADRPPN